LTSIRAVKAAPTLMELAPVLIQISAVGALLALVQDDLALSLAGAILGLVWFRVTRSPLQDQYAELRLQRALFLVMGNWLGRDDAEEAFDRSSQEALQAAGSLEDDDYKTAVAAEAIANMVRSLASFLLYGYVALTALIAWLRVFS
jgi:hypothetical protein